MVGAMMGLVMTSTGLNAHKGATGIVKQRMDTMSDMGDAMKAMADIIKGKRDFNTGVIRDAAGVLAKHSSEIVEFFPDTRESTESKESDALPEIWASWDRFSLLADKMVVAVDALNVAAQSDLDKRSFRMVFSKTAKACSACHDDYRRPEE